MEDIFKKEPTNPKCPSDNEPLERHLIFRDKCAQKEILALECYCPKKSLGCQWRGKRAQLQVHDALECSFSEEKCLYNHLGCEVVVLRYQLAKHVGNDCLYKVVECPYCQRGLPGIKMREHLEECGKFPVKCPHGCEKSDIPRERQQEHSKSCPHAPVLCSFSSMGCNFQGCRESLDEHLRTHATEHLTLSDKFIENVLAQMKNVQLKLNAAQELNQTYEARLALQNEALALNKQMLSTHQVKLGRVEENLDAQRKSLDELRKSVETMANFKESKPASDEVKQRLNLQDERLEVLVDEVTRLGAAAEGSRARPRDYDRASVPSLAGSDHRFDRVEHSLTLHEIQLADQDLKLQILETTSNSKETLSGKFIENLLAQVKNLQLQQDATMQSQTGSDHRLNCVEHSLALHEIQLADQDLKLQILETTSHDGTFLWKIDNFQQRFRESVEGKTISIYSPPFYTTRYGYKLCALAYLNGNGSGKGIYLSLFVAIMQGKYDSLLPWPFQQKITMKLLDQEQVSHVTNTFRPDPNSQNFQRPRSEMNIATGCPLFCSHSQLRSRGYVRNDTMFIKIIVDGINMPLELRRENITKKIRENEENGS